MTALATFFAEMGPFLRGERSAEDVLAVLGPSPSGTARFAQYAELVSRQRRGILDRFYRSAAAIDPVRFASLRDDGLRRHPPSHWSPNEVAGQFAAHVAEREDVDEAVRELVDFAWIRFRSMHTAHVPEEEGLDASLFVRHYAHDVTSFSNEVEAHPARRALLVRKPVTLIVTRHRIDGSLVVVTPSLSALLALACSASGSPPSLPPGVSWPMVAAGATELERAGAISERVARRIHERVAR